MSVSGVEGNTHAVTVAAVADPKWFAMWSATCGCGWKTEILPTREDARIRAREHLGVSL